MAIKGYLSDINFVELLKIVGNYNGKLLVWNFTENKHYECFFSDKSVIYLNFCGKVVSAKEAVKNVILELSADKKSYYAFQDDSFGSRVYDPIVSINELISSSLIQDSEADDELLPNIHTRFETVNKNDFEVQGEMSDFWKSAARLLHRGCSAGEICAELGLDEKTARRNLYKLRTTGLIKPVRMFSATGSMAKSRAMNQNLSRLAGSLNKARQAPKLTQPNPSLQKNVTPVQQSQPASNSADWENVYENGNYPDSRQSQPNKTAFEQDAVFNFSTEEIPMPRFLSVSEAFIPLAPPQVVSNASVDSQVEKAVDAESSDLQNAEMDSNVVQTYSAGGIRVSDASVQTTSNLPANTATATLIGNQEEPPTQNRTSVSSTRTGLIKRMLNSLFKN